MSNDELVSMTMAQLVCFASLVDVLVDHHGLRRADLADALEQAPHKYAQDLTDDLSRAIVKATRQSVLGSDEPDLSDIQEWLRNALRRTPPQ